MKYIFLVNGIKVDTIAPNEKVATDNIKTTFPGYEYKLISIESECKCHQCKLKNCLN